MVHSMCIELSGHVICLKWRKVLKEPLHSNKWCSEVIYTLVWNLQKAAWEESEALKCQPRVCAQGSKLGFQPSSPAAEVRMLRSIQGTMANAQSSLINILFHFKKIVLRRAAWQPVMSQCFCLLDGNENQTTHAKGWLGVLQTAPVIRRTGKMVVLTFEFINNVMVISWVT